MKFFSLSKNSVILKNTEPKHNPAIKPVRIVNFIIISLIVFCLGISAWFVYTNIFLTIGKVQTILSADASPHFEPINFVAYEKAISAWEKRKTPTIEPMYKDPFNETPVSTTTLSNTPKIEPSTNNIEISL